MIKKMMKSKRFRRNDHPNSFICPLRCQVMSNPVVCRCGHCFERDAIVEWIASGKSFCPISRKELTNEDLSPNHQLAEQIERWKWRREHESELRDLCEDNKGDRVHHLSIHHNPDIEMGHSETDSDRDATVFSCEDEIPGQMMLLPQERKALELLRQQNAFERRRRRRRCILYFLAAAIVVNSTLFVALMVWIQFRSTDLDVDEDDLEQLQDTGNR